MNITLQLFGRFRDFADAPELHLELPGVTTTAEFRAGFEAWARAHWPDAAIALLQASAIATDTTLLHPRTPLPADGRLALLPPVSGG
ncbi:MoaD/ThiS family protein [Thermomonas mangrovi]|uniref:MoaD/ThiS family protein n=1 Tax=Thermomonas mangrovi TaxID=2993316 RepID=UPI002307A8B9|nr:MoaD/ThiS family protein [Thermomonas mangrovi]